MQDLTPVEVKHLLETSDPAPLLLDVREPWEFDTVCLDHSVLFPLRNLPNARDKFPLDQEVIVICHHGIRSMHAARYLESVGFNRIINLKGGIDRWARDLDPSMPVY